MPDTADPQPKPGLKTSEGWLAALVAVVGALLAADVIPTDHWAAKVGGALMAALASLGYSQSRGNVKG